MHRSVADLDGASVEPDGASHEIRSAAAEVVSNAERQAARIGGIVGAITCIAGQTNLLALNAAIEAHKQVAGRFTVRGTEPELTRH